VAPPQRVVVVGNARSGKTTLSSQLAARLGAEHIEIDAIHHLADWTPIEREEMRRIVRERTNARRWVVDGGYGGMVGDIVFGRADTVVWLDSPLGRMLRGTKLWNGNRERLRYLFDPRPESNIILATWLDVRRLQALYPTMQADPVDTHLRWVRIASSAQLKVWLADLA
jgi:adenylate kinase family enzyme